MGCGRGLRESLDGTGAGEGEGDRAHDGVGVQERRDTSEIREGAVQPSTGSRRRFGQACRFGQDLASKVKWLTERLS
jgi:hypothetical protein